MCPKRETLVSQPSETSIDDLPGNVLVGVPSWHLSLLFMLIQQLQIEIFKRLPMYNHVRVERVSRRWQLLAQKHSWTNFRYFAYTPPGQMKDESAAVAWLYTMFKRCGSHLRAVGFFGVPLCYEACALLSLTPNALILNLSNLWDKERSVRDEHLEQIGIELPHLKALSIWGYVVSLE